MNPRTPLTRIPIDSRPLFVSIALALCFMLTIGGTALWRAQRSASQQAAIAALAGQPPGALGTGHQASAERSPLPGQPPPTLSGEGFAPSTQHQARSTAMPIAHGVQGAPSKTDLVARYFAVTADAIATDTAHAYRSLAANPSKGSAAFRAASGEQLTAQINARLVRLGVQARPVMLSAVRESARRGVVDAHKQLRALGVREAAGAVGLGTSGEGFALVDEGAVAKVAQDSLARMLRAAGSHGANAQAVFRTLSSASAIGGKDAAVNAIIARGIITGSPRDTQKAIRLMFAEKATGENVAIAEEGAKAYRRLGARQIEVGGWTGSVRDYAEMVAITRTREATVDARHDRLLEADIHLVQITGNNTANFCTRFLNLVCALDEASTDGGTYPLLESLPGGGPPFHPRCSKGTVAYAPELVSKGRVDAHGKALTNYRRDLAAGTLEDPLLGAAANRRSA